MIKTYHMRYCKKIIGIYLTFEANRTSALKVSEGIRGVAVCAISTQIGQTRVKLLFTVSASVVDLVTNTLVAIGQVNAVTVNTWIGVTVVDVGLTVSPCYQTSKMIM